MNHEIAKMEVQILYIPSTELNNRFNHAYRFCETLTGANYASGICYRVPFTEVFYVMILKNVYIVI